MHLLKKGAAALLIALLGFSQMVTPIRASQVSEPVTSSSLDANWPSGPSTASETAILIEAETGTILYEKDAHRQMYPASITKLLTTLIAFEMCELDETVTFTYEALATIPYDSSRIWVDKDEYMSMEDCLAAILIMSANDVAAGVAEHIAGELDAFADIMNERAKELGCLNSHFVNSHGYHDPDHYTTAYDMAQIGRAFFENELLCSFARERNFKHGPTEGQPDPIDEWNQNKLLPTRSYEYEYLVGSKTGYTSDAGQTLISCAQKDGLKLICVVMNAVKPDQYKDTVTLFDWGFSNFTTANIYDNDKTYVSADSSYGMDVIDVLGDSAPLLNMDRDSILVLPKTADFSEITSYVTMATEEENCMAIAHYQYGTHDVGTAQIYVTAHTGSLQDASGELEQIEELPPIIEEEPSPIYVNIKQIAMYVLPSVLGIGLILFGYRRIIAYRKAKNPSLSRRRMNHRFSVIKNLFISFVQGLQAIVGVLQSKIKSIATRTRYKKRTHFNNVTYPSYHKSKRRRSTAVDYNLKTSPHSVVDYSNNPEYKRKHVVFHDVNK